MPAVTPPHFRNPIWTAATSLQQHWTTGEGQARLFDPDVLPFAAMSDGSAEAMDALAALVPPGEHFWMFEEPPNHPAWRVVRVIPGYQMICETLTPKPRREKLAKSVLLDPVNAAGAMFALKAIAFPGLFGPRTPQIGRYRGIHVDGELVAMAGERLAVPGGREVSAVCTHPAYLGRGYAQQLTREVTATILAEGDVPFLHVAGANAAALHVYEQLGYRCSAGAVFVELERLAG